MRRSIYLQERHVKWIEKRMEDTGAKLAGVIRNLIEKEIKRDERRAESKPN